MRSILVLLFSAAAVLAAPTPEADPGYEIVKLFEAANSSELDARGLSLDWTLKPRGLLQERQGSCMSITINPSRPSVNNIGQVDIDSVILGRPGAIGSWELNNFITIGLNRVNANTVRVNINNTGRTNRLIITQWDNTLTRGDVYELFGDYALIQGRGSFCLNIRSDSGRENWRMQLEN
uniref:ToxA n=2 Tax=Parastagonospora TaxID=1351751 RepID=M1GM61_9PLEO|nr:ToxA [Parastagonospora pseudonodorum]AGE15693.1 ToxA [Parastagonospora nodorum]AGE15694.1 ToxA [Parastagonospora nodorum]AGE15695.1 ToxA [Parastagonospora pseudonodorum]WKF18940.1 toxin A [Parastagonospora nodorum]